MEKTLNYDKLVRCSMPQGSRRQTGPHNSHPLTSNRIEVLRKRINDENYIRAAIQRLALIMSNELIEISEEGGYYERQWKKRKQPQK